MTDVYSDEVFHHSWETDEGWINIERRLDIPPEFSDQRKRKFLLKRKRKYYKKKINPEYVASERKFDLKPGETMPEKAPEAEAKSEPKDWRQTETEQNDEPFSQEIPQPDRPAPEPSQEPQPEAEAPNSKAKKPSKFFLKCLLYSYPFCHLGVIICAIMFLVGQRAFYTYAILLNVYISFSWLTYKEGRPSFNAAFAQKILTNPNTFNLLSSLALFACKANFMGLAAPVCRSLAEMESFCKLINKFVPAIGSKMKSLLSPIISRKQLFTNFAPVIEVYYGAFLIGGWFFGMSSFVSIFAYWQFLRMKYVYVTETKAAFSKLKQDLDGKIPGMIHPYWQKLCNFVYSYVDPAQMQRQAGGQSGGGLMSKCTIM